MARKKSLGHIQPLIFATTMMKPDDILELFEILCSFVKRGAEDAKAGGAFVFEETLAKSVIIGIAHVLQHYKGQPLDDMLAAAWDGLCRWCIQFSERFGAQVPRFDQTFGILLEKGTRNAEIKKRIGGDRQLLRYMAKEWARRYDEEGGYSSRNLVRLCSDPKIKEKLHNLILRYHLGFADSTAEHLIKRILFAAHGAEMHPKSLEVLRDMKFPLMYERVLWEIQMTKTVRSFISTRVAARTLTSYN